MNKDKIIYELWKLLDDIDTASDMLKDDAKHGKYTQRRVLERHKIIGGKDIDTLYDKYHPKDVGEE